MEKIYYLCIRFFLLMYARTCVKEGENIERALKKFKRKFEKTGVVKELRSRQQFNKPSVLKRLKMEHAIYVQQLRRAEEA